MIGLKRVRVLHSNKILTVTGFIISCLLIQRWFSTCCTVFGYSSGETNLHHVFIDNFDIIDVHDIVHSKVISTRDIKENSTYYRFDDEPIKKIQFTSLGRKFHLILRNQRDLITNDFSVITLDAENNATYVPFDRSKLQIMSGTLQDDPKSIASAWFNNVDNLMTAHIKTDSELVIVEPAQLHQKDLKFNYRNYSNDIPQDSKILNNSMIVYRLSDYKKSLYDLDNDVSICPSIDLDQYMNISVHSDDSSIVENKSERKTKRNIEYITEPNRDRSRCSLHMVADYLFYQQVGKGDLQTTINYILALINRVNQIYLSVVWHVDDEEDSEKFTNIGFSVQNITVHQDYTRISIQDKHYNMQKSQLWSARDFLENFSRNSPPRHYCLAHLLTYREFDTPVLGLAYVASHRFGTIGGVCSPPQYRENLLYRHNTGISTSRSITGETLITRQADLVVAHELGHNMGAEHDSAECRPSLANGGAYLMHPFSVMGFEKNNRNLSNCSIISIGKVIKRKGPNCFVAVMKHVCGNGIVEDKEECDGGDIGLSQNDPCCDNMCRLRPDAQCSDRHSWCCSKCKIMPAGTACRPAEEYNCRQTGYCNGHNAECPESLPVEDNQSCVARGLCKKGECVPFCEVRNLTSCLCNNPTHACDLCCKSSPNGKCVPYDELGATKLPDGVLCYRGICKKGKCEQPVQDVVARLWDILEDLTFSTFVKFLRDNIILLVLFITIPLWCLASHLINLWDQRVRYDVTCELRNHSDMRLSIKKTATITSTKEPNQAVAAPQPFAFSAMVEALSNVPGNQNGNKLQMIGQSTHTFTEHEIQRMELLCQQVYQSGDPIERSKAEREILEFASSPNSLAISTLLLDRANSPYSQLLGAQTLVKVVCSKPNNLNVDQKLQLRNYAVRYLASHINSASFVIQSLTKLFAIITKSIWFEILETQEILPLIHQQFISHVNDLDRQTVGVMLLNQLIQEINQAHQDPLIHRTITRQRKVATSFRDEHLVDIFMLACTLLRENLLVLTEEQTDLQGNLNKRYKLTESTLKLTHSCLSFDFIGTSPDESNSDDLPTVQIPSSWRRLFVEEDTVELFFRLYHRLPSDISRHSIACLVQLTSIRRSLFNTNERYNFLVKILMGIEGVIINFKGLSDPNTYHEFCRLLVRFKSNFQLSELAKAPKFENWLVLVRDMTIHSFKQHISPNSIHYLLMFWQKLVSSSNYCKGSFDRHLDGHAPKIFRAYVENRLEGVKAFYSDNSCAVDDFLEDTTMIQQQMEHLAHLSRQNFKENAEFLISTFEQAAHRYTELIQMSEAPETEFQIITSSLAWLVYIVGSTIHGRIFILGEADETFEGELVSLVMQLSQLSDSQLLQNRNRCEKLELAFLSFFEIYRKCHLCELGGGRIHKRLVETLNLDNESHLYSIYILKIIKNLNCWSSSEPIIRHTLDIFHELSQGFANMHKLYELDQIKFMIRNHSAQHFPFLSNSASIEFMRHRTSFYCSLSKHLIESMRFGNEETFDDFLLPIDRALNDLNELVLNESEESVSKNENAKRAFIGVCRDIRGVAKEFVRPNYYNLLFEWLFPKYTVLLRKSLQLWYNDSNATTPALRLIGELTDTREKRAYNDHLTSDALYLFIEVSKILVGFGDKLLTLTDIPNEQLYQFKLKPISLMFKIIQLLLRSRVNYAVFQLYGDPSLRDVLQMFVKLFVSIMNCDILSYPKLSLQYYPLLEVISANHAEFVSNIEPQILRCLLTSLHAGISVSDDRICTSSFVTINNILSQNFKWFTKPPRKIGSPHRAKEDEERRELSRRLLDGYKEVFHSMMVTMLEILMSIDQISHPQLPLPLLVIILLYEDKFNQLRTSMVKAQKTPVAEKIVNHWFDTLMDGVCFNVSQSNREKFIQNVLNFKREVSEGSKIVVSFSGCIQ